MNQNDKTMQTISENCKDSTSQYKAIDHAFRANLAKYTLGLSPAGLLRDYFDWASHLALSPGKQLELTEKNWKKDPSFYVTQSSLL